MAEEGKGIAMAILGIVAVIAVVGLVLLFKGGATGNVAGSTAGAKIYGGGEIARGLDQYRSDDQFTRYSDNRATHGRLYSYDWSDDFRDRIEDSGNGVPYATYNADYKRGGPVKDNPCPFPPYSDKVTGLYAQGRECLPAGVDPASGEQVVWGYEDFMCCI
jgi:hypothetical protein